ncbi:MAG: DUF4962 domain-containing protein, partial [Verrucomicrobiota bacterium]
MDSAPPSLHHPQLAPADGATVAVNPPALTWRVDERAASYTVEFSPTPEFDRDLIRARSIPQAYYNHTAALAEGRWFWRYYAVTKAGEISNASAVQSFVVPAGIPWLPLPPIDAVLAAMPGHPRVFTTPGELDEFRARRQTPAGRIAWEQIRLKADEALHVKIVRPELLPLPERFETHRRQVFWLDPKSG